MLFFLCIGFSLGPKNEEYVHPQSDYLHTDDIFDVMMPQQIDTKPWLLLVSVSEKKKSLRFCFFFKFV